MTTSLRAGLTQRRRADVASAMRIIAAIGVVMIGARCGSGGLLCHEPHRPRRFFVPIVAGIVGCIVPGWACRLHRFFVIESSAPGV